MKPPAFAYHAPRTVDEVVDVLGQLGDEGKVLAGGQSLIPLMNLRLAMPEAIVDLSHVRGLDAVHVIEGRVRIEARATHERVRRDDTVADALPLLRQALDHVAHPVIRNRGTALGSIVHADPSGELPAVLALLDGEVELRSVRGVRTVTGPDYLVGPLESDTEPDELATSVSFATLPRRSGTAFEELARRHGDYALAGVGVRVDLDDDLRVRAARAGFLGVGSRPVVVELDGTLVGQQHDALDVSGAVEHARSQLSPSDDLHASGAYRRHLAGVLLGRGLRAAARNATARAAGKETA